MSGAEAGTASIDRAIGARLRARRVALGLSQDQLAQALGVSYQQVQKYENGSNRIAAARLVVLAERLKTTVAALTGETARPAAGPVPSPAGDDTMRQRAALDLARGFVGIEDAGVRQALVALIEAIRERQG